MMKRTNIYLTESQEKIIAEMIKINKMGTKAQLVRNAIDEYIDKYRRYSPNNYLTINTVWKSPGLPDWADKLPEKLDIGKHIKVTKGHSWVGKSGIVKTHFINGDDCGDWGKAYYNFIADDNKEQYSVRVENCEFIS